MKRKRGFPLFKFIVIISVLCIAGSVFYYFVIFLPGKENFRQVQFTKCDDEAKLEAKDFLRKKIEMSEATGNTYSNQYKVWIQAYNQGLYLKDDYNAIFESCIRRYGFKY